jgi:hypothetical protein
MQKNTEGLLHTGKEASLELNSEKTKYMLMSHEKAGQNRDIKIANRSFECVAKFKYFGTTLTDQNCMQDEIKSRLNSGNACYHPVQSLLSSRLLSRNIRVKIYKTMILRLALCGCETWFLTLKEGHRVRVFENRVLRRIFGPRRDEVTGEWRKLHNADLHILYYSPNIIRQIKSRRMRWAGHVARMREEGNLYRVLMGKRPLGKSRRRWEDGISGS